MHSLMLRARRLAERLVFAGTTFHGEEFFLDVGLGLAVVLLSSRLAPAAWNPPPALYTHPLTGLVIVFFLTLFIGRLYHIYDLHLPYRGWRRALLRGALFAAVNWAYWAPYFLTGRGLLAGPSPPSSLLIAWLYPTLSVAALLLAGVDDYGLYYLQSVLLSLAWVIALIMLWLPALLIGTLGVFLVLGGAVGLRWAWQKASLWSLPRLQKAAAVLQRVGLPLMFGVVLNLWQTMTLLFGVRFYALLGRPARGEGILLGLVLSGVIPLRLLMNLAPPWRWRNTLFGLVMFAWYLRVVLSWVYGL